MLFSKKAIIYLKYLHEQLVLIDYEKYEQIKLLLCKGM